MNKINYLYILLLTMVSVAACQDEETGIPPKPQGITYGSVTDKAGNTYKTLTIGNQTWLAENYRYALPNGSLDGCVTYGESYGSDREILNGTNQNAYQNFCRSHSGQRFLLYLSEALFNAGEEGKIPAGTGTGQSIWLSQQVSNYNIPQLITMSGTLLTPVEEVLMTIWNDAIDYHFNVDKDYLSRFGYLYSYEGALRAVQEGAPDGFHLPTDAEWMVLERKLGMNPAELEGLENWRGEYAGELLKAGEQGIGFDALYGGAAVYALSTAYNSRYANRNKGAYFWCSDRVFVSDSLSNGIVRHISLYETGIRRTTSRLISSPTVVRPSYNVRLVKTITKKEEK